MKQKYFNLKFKFFVKSAFLLALIFFAVYSVQSQKIDHLDSYYKTASFYQNAFSKASAPKTYVRIYGGIIPHHLMVKEKIASFMLGLKKYDYETIVLIGPNHFNLGDSELLTSELSWQTPFGNLEADKELIGRLGRENKILANDAVLNHEHAISGLVGFIKRALPKIKFVPIIIKPSISSEKIEKLANSLYQNIDPEKTLVLASVDFSHYQPVSVADFHDEISNNAIRNFEIEKIKKLEIDSPASIAVLLKYLEKIKAQKASLIYHTNSSELLKIPDSPSTSHNFFYFTPGTVPRENSTSMLFFGDLMIDRYVLDRINKKNNKIDFLLAPLAGEENRFFQSPDIISANLEGAVTNKGAHYAPSLSNDFAFAPELVSQFKKYNFNYFNLANNHLTDQGAKGVAETRTNLKNLKLNVAGCADGQAGACSTSVLVKGNLRIGLAGFSMVYKNINISEIKKQIKELKKKSDLVVVNFHWGQEYQTKFNVSQQNYAHAAIEAGADIVIGHHPHVVQGMEIYSTTRINKQGIKEAVKRPIFYSLGNFIFDQYFSQNTQTGLAVGTVFGEKQIELYLLPFSGKSSMVSLLKGEAKSRFLKDFKNNSKTTDYGKMITGGKISIPIK
jgi:AmmeMemoRadiSam system protein B